MRVWAPQKLYVQQPDAADDMPNPLSGTRYVVLAPQANVRLKSIWASCMWSEQPSHLQVYLTLSAKEIIFTKTDPISGTGYMAELQDQRAPFDQVLATIPRLAYRAFILEDRLVNIEVVVIGGTVSLLQWRAKWAKC